jgi:hypothetical protein
VQRQSDFAGRIQLVVERDIDFVILVRRELVQLERFFEFELLVVWIELVFVRIKFVIVRRLRIVVIELESVVVFASSDRGWLGGAAGLTRGVPRGELALARKIDRSRQHAHGLLAGVESHGVFSLDEVEQKLSAAL